MLAVSFSRIRFRDTWSYKRRYLWHCGKSKVYYTWIEYCKLNNKSSSMDGKRDSLPAIYGRWSVANTMFRTSTSVQWPIHYWLDSNYLAAISSSVLREIDTSEISHIEQFRFLMQLQQPSTDKKSHISSFGLLRKCNENRKNYKQWNTDTVFGLTKLDERQSGINGNCVITTNLFSNVLVLYDVNSPFGSFAVSLNALFFFSLKSARYGWKWWNKWPVKQIERMYRLNWWKCICLSIVR